MPLRDYITNSAPQVKKNSLPANYGIHAEIETLLTRNTAEEQNTQMITI